MASKAPQRQGKREKKGAFARIMCKFGRLFTSTKKVQRPLQDHPGSTKSHEGVKEWDLESEYTVVAGVDDPTESDKRHIRRSTETYLDSHGLDLRGQVSRDEREKDDHRRRILRVQRDKRTLENRLAKTEERLAKATKSRERLDCELSRKEERVTSLSQSLHSSEQEHAAMQKALESKTGESSILETRVAEMQEENKALCREITVRELRLQGHKKRLGAAEAHIMNLGSSFDALLSREEAASVRAP